VIWDSVAATSPKAELEGDYDQNTIGLQARVLGKGFRKLTNVLANEKVTLVCVQQQREKIGVMFGDPTTTPGGKALGYASSVRITLNGGSPIKKVVGKEEKVIGVNVYAKVIKNRMSFPFRKVDFQIHFGKGIVEDEQIFDHLREWCEASKSNPCVYKNQRIWVEGAGAWKTFFVADNSSGEITKEIKFYKAEFGDRILRNSEIEDYVNALMDSAYIMKNEEHLTYKGGTEAEIADNQE
jgi:recombination protein RecA